MSDIYLVVGNGEYEGFDLVRAFHNRKNADDFAELCRKHHEQMPRCPEEDSDAAWTSYDRRAVRWVNKHPAGKQHTSYPYYDVEVIETGDTPK